MRSSSELTALRRDIRKRRLELLAADRHQASITIFSTLIASNWYRRAQRVAAYLAFEGEFDPAPVVDHAIDNGKTIYLPIVAANKQMRFAPYCPGDALIANRFGIPEPQVAVDDCSPPEALDLVLTPLVGFDDQGVRLGMGGGFYDRCFAFRATALAPPYLVGLAFELQRVATLPQREWDIPLDGVISEHAVYTSSGNP